VVAILKGGLGNQLFAYAAARAFALRSGRDLWLDTTSGFVRDGYGRAYRLDRFPVAAPAAPTALRLGGSKSLRHKTVRALDRLLPPRFRCYLAEDTRREPSQLLDWVPSRQVVHLNGYWQNEAYFADCAATIRRELAPPPLANPADQALERELAAANSVFLHIRRQRYTPRLGRDYYLSSIEAARQAVPECCFVVFGDDPAWAREHLAFGGAPVRYIEESAAAELRDFRLMSVCRHAIVANSSFSWWAAWLGEAPGQRVWTPAAPGWPVTPAAGWSRVPNTLERDVP